MMTAPRKLSKQATRDKADTYEARGRTSQIGDGQNLDHQNHGTLRGCFFGKIEDAPSRFRHRLRHFQPASDNVRRGRATRNCRTLPKTALGCAGSGRTSAAQPDSNKPRKTVRAGGLR